MRGRRQCGGGQALPRPGRLRGEALPRIPGHGLRPGAPAHITGNQLGLDPLLIIAVIAIESRFNPIAESVAGAKGLMQIIPKYHSDKLEEYGGEKAVFDPVANVKIGAQILKDYIRATGNVGIGLQMYAGALGDGEDQYTTKVMNEQQRLRQGPLGTAQRVHEDRGDPSPRAAPPSIGLAHRRIHGQDSDCLERRRSDR